MDQRIIDLYDDFTHSSFDRRAFMERLIVLVGSATAAEEALRLLAPDYAQAAVTSEADDRIVTSSYRDDASGMSGYLATPKGVKLDAAHNFVVVIHENRGLNPHIQDVTRRLATEGFVAMAPDLLAPLGGTPTDGDKAVQLFTKIDLDETAQSLAKLITSIKGQDPKRKVGAIGFCWGGAMVNILATRAPNLDVGVSYYGLAPKIEEVANIKATMMLHYGALDARVNATQPAYEDALKKAQVAFTSYTYEGANHAFNNDTSAERYNADAAKLAWSRSVELLKKKLLS